MTTMATPGPLWRPLCTTILILFLLSHEGLAFSPFSRQSVLYNWRHPTPSSTGAPLRRDTAMAAALTPTGPFCPFRSSAALEMEPRMDHLKDVTPKFATEMARIQLDLQTGNTPDANRLRKVAEGINQAVDEWKGLTTRLKLSNDFQTREYAKLTQAHLETFDMTVEKIASMMTWQSKCMQAMADNAPPPMPPPDVEDVIKQMMNDPSKNNADKQPPSVTSMLAADKITSSPFTGEEDVFESQTVRDEYERLCEDHAALIEMGASYANFDPAGKIAYIDEIEKIEDRWQVFFARFKLLGKLNKEFLRQCNEFLASMGMDEAQYNQLLKRAHDIMRDDAEKERNLMGM